MSFKSILTPSQSVGASLAVVGLVVGVHSAMTPNVATIRATDAYDRNLEDGRKKAAWTCVALVSAMTLLTKDVNILILGGGVTVGMDFMERHAIAMHPVTGQIVTQTPAAPTLQAVS